MESTLTGKKNPVALESARPRKIDNFRPFLEKVWKCSKPQTKIFKNESKSSIYDTYTNKIMR